MGEFKIPYIKPSLTAQDAIAAAKAIQEGHVADGHYVRQFEAVCKERFGGYWVACSSGTAALRLCFEAWNWNTDTPENRLIGRAGCYSGYFIGAPDFTFNATYEALYGRERLHDNWLSATTWDDDKKEWVCQPKTAGFCRVTLGGFPMRIVGHAGKWNDISDDCQSFGILRSTCQRSAYSFAASKVITCGHGGAARFESEVEADIARQLRNHRKIGSEYEHERGGFNYMMSDVSAAMLLSQMARLDALVEARHTASSYLRKHIRVDGVFGPTLRMLLASDSKERDLLRARLQSAGVETRLPYNGNVDFHSRGLFLPTWALGDEEVKLIASCI